MTENYIVTWEGIAKYSTLTLKQLGLYIQNVTLFASVVDYQRNIFVWNWFNTMNM